MFMFIYSTVAKLGYVYMWKGRTGEKSKPVWPGGLMPSIDAIEVSFGSSQVLQGSYDTLLYDEYVRQPGNQVVAYSFTLPIWWSSCTVSRGDPLPFVIRSLYWFAGPKSAVLAFAGKWKIYVLHIFFRICVFNEMELIFKICLTLKPTTKTNISCPVYCLAALIIRFYKRRSTPSKLNASYWILVPANQNVPYVTPATINYKIV